MWTGYGRRRCCGVSENQIRGNPAETGSDSPERRDLSVHSPSIQKRATVDYNITHTNKRLSRAEHDV